MAIVWACELSVDKYKAAGRKVEVPRPDCPSCSAPMTFRSGYLRNLRVKAEADHRIWVRRAKCRPCGVSHALLPSFCLVRRMDPVWVIGAVITAVVTGGVGVRSAVADTVAPHSTGRGWVRRFGARSEVLGAAFAAAVVELGDDGFVPAAGPAPAAALGALRVAWRAFMTQVGLRAPSLWAFASLITGGKLLAGARDVLSIRLGRRRLIPPAP